MKKIKRLIFLFIAISFLFGGVSKNTVFADETVYLGGMPAGFSIEMRGAYIAGLCDVITDDGLISPAKESGICKGDVILSIDGSDVNNSVDIEENLKNGDKKILEVERVGEKIFKEVIPAKDVNGKFKLGVFVRDGINGIGTVTYIKGDRFASLGHPVLDENNDIIDIIGGKLYKCNITGYIKGESGKAGELHGVFIKKKEIGSIDKNMISGVYGNINGIDKSSLIKIETGVGKVGDASIYTTINGNTPKEYKISIVKAENNGESVKNFVIKIVDDELLDLTSGIIQGMSGSPIVQNGKLVGAVTHVFINDPTRGFGISLDNMINN